MLYSHIGRYNMYLMCCTYSAFLYTYDCCYNISVIFGTRDLCSSKIKSADPYIILPRRVEYYNGLAYYTVKTLFLKTYYDWFFCSRSTAEATLQKDIFRISKRVDRAVAPCADSYNITLEPSANFKLSFLPKPVWSIVSIVNHIILIDFSEFIMVVATGCRCRNLYIIGCSTCCLNISCSHNGDFWIKIPGGGNVVEQ